MALQKLTEEKLAEIKNIIAENSIYHKGKTLRQMAAEAQTSPANISYYKVKMGFSKKHKTRKASYIAKKKYKARETGSKMSLSEAIAICKDNGLKVTRETVKVEEL